MSLGDEGSMWPTLMPFLGNNGFIEQTATAAIINPGHAARALRVFVVQSSARAVSSMLFGTSFLATLSWALRISWGSVFP